MDDSELLVCRPGSFVRAGAAAGFFVFMVVAISSDVSSKSKIFSLFDEKARSVVSYALSKSSCDRSSHDVPALRHDEDDEIDDDLKRNIITNKISKNHRLNN